MNNFSRMFIKVVFAASALASLIAVCNLAIDIYLLSGRSPIALILVSIWCVLVGTACINIFFDLFGHEKRE